MKKTLIGFGIVALMASCGGYSETQGEAAVEMCECMAQDAYGDYDINYYECDVQLHEKYDPEVFEEGSWPEALEEKCPDLN
ncbi:hypothetical protein N8987_01380 [Crocinitomix sp.]|nr:hypothetical protein [Crocinitomix sp.]